MNTWFFGRGNGTAGADVFFLLFPVWRGVLRYNWPTYPVCWNGGDGGGVLLSVLERLCFDLLY